MKNLYLKAKNYFKGININFNLILGILMVMGLIFITIKVTKSRKEERALEVEKARIELLTESLKVSNLSQPKKDSIKAVIGKLNEQLNENEKRNWSDLFNSDPDSVARDVTDWHNANSR